MQDGWVPEIFSTCEAGVSSAFDPELIPQNQLSWLRNGRVRGGKQHTRPFLRERLVLPQGLVQGVNYFSVQGGMIVMSIAGRIYRIRVGIRDDGFSYQEIPLDWLNSPVIPEVWMQETVGSLVIQDGQSLPIIYDGSTARRSDIEENEVPLGRMMAYGNGRLWVAINTNEVVAGDIKTRQFQSELKFTETTYFQGGGAFYFPTALTGLKFVPASGAAGYGSLAVFGLNRTDLVRADVAFRDLWATMPGFIQPLLLSTGAIGQFSITEVNQDIFWRDGDGGIRSLRTAVADEVSGPGLAPISREVARITDYESVHRLGSCSSIYLDNRLLMTASPFINIYGKTSFRDLIALDFSPVSSMRGKSPPSYDGEWDGLLFDRLISGKFNGSLRGFAVSTDYDGNNRLWEIVERQESDTYYTCAGTSMLTESPVPMIAEYPARTFGEPKRRKRLERCDLYLSDIEGDCTLSVYFRADNYQKWTLWDTVEVCANTTDPEGPTPHVWKNLLGQERPQVRTFSITDSTNPITNYSLKIGFQHQIRTVLTGKCKIQQMVVYASMVPEEQFADRTQEFAACADNDVTGNEITYLISPEECPSGTVEISGDGDFGDVETESQYDARYFIDLSGILTDFPTAIAVWMYPVVGAVSDFLSSVAPIYYPDFTSNFDLGATIEANFTTEGLQGLIFTVQTDSSTEVAIPISISSQSGGFSTTSYENKYGNFNFLGSSVTGVLFPGVDVGPPPTNLMQLEVLSEDNGYAFGLAPS